MGRRGAGDAAKRKTRDSRYARGGAPAALGSDRVVTVLMPLVVEVA